MQFLPTSDPKRSVWQSILWKLSSAPWPCFWTPQLQQPQLSHRLHQLAPSGEVRPRTLHSKLGLPKRANGNAIVSGRSPKSDDATGCSTSTSNVACRAKSFGCQLEQLALAERGTHCTRDGSTIGAPVFEQCQCFQQCQCSQQPKCSEKNR